MPAKLEDTAGCHDSCGTQLVSFQLAVLSQLVKQRFPNNCTTLTTYRLLDKVMRSIYLKKQEADSSAALMEDLRKWYLEKQLKQLLLWLETEGEEILEKHKVMPENIKGIRSQQKDFEKLYFSAMVGNTR
ncbi:hypothetical protein LSH36_69g05009 [Paralvinella palmiformis]|uniref:Uncharacterized protein n=1 Tax=Paralvinella palmiformis TaxID=53620 RepID=A0AAD9K360_9ANNE|nr:hypothetical protein LSH36_69g05009 [Paralvinella palmiformis]